MKNKSPLLIIFLTSFLDMLAFGLVVPVFGFLFETQDTPFSLIYDEQQLKFLYLLLMGSFSIGTLIGAPVVGALSDKFGRKKMLLFNYSAAIFFYSIFFLGILFTNYWLLLIARLLGGLTGGALLVMQSAIADVSSPEDKAKNFGIPGIAFGLGFIIGAFFGGILADSSLSPYFGFTTPFYFANLVILINIIFLWVVFKETNLERNPNKVSLWTGPKNVVKAFTNPSLKHIFVVIFLVTVAFNFQLQFYQFYARDYLAFSKSGIGFLLAFVGVSVAISQGLILRPVSNRFKPGPVLAVSLILFALAYPLLLLPTTQSGFFGTTFVLLAFQGIVFPTTLAVVSNRADKKIQGETIGINQAVQSAAAATPILIGALLDIQYTYPMWFGLVLTVAAWIWFLVFCYRR